METTDADFGFLDLKYSSAMVSYFLGKDPVRLSQFS